VIELLFKRALYRTLAEIRRIHSGGIPPETSTTPPSPATRLPLKVVQIIVGYLTYDARSLRACTLTCYSWYIAAAPHLHHTLVIVYSSFYRKPRCPRPIRYMYILGLLPLVKELLIRYGYRHTDVWISPKLFNCCILHQFSALSNVQELILDRLDVPSFIPRIRRYFGHFSPTVKVSTSENPGDPVGRSYTSSGISNTRKTSSSPTTGLTLRRNQRTISHSFLRLCLLWRDGLRLRTSRG